MNLLLLVLVFLVFFSGRAWAQEPSDQNADIFHLDSMREGLSEEEREIGGLGIYMVKKTMDVMRYEYSDGRNRLTITKSF